MMQKTASRPMYDLSLYVSGATPRSHRAISNIKKICEKYLQGRYNLQIIDIFQNPSETVTHNIVAAPTLIKEAPLPMRRFIGDLSDTEKVTHGLALTTG
jgi:circadian clock protein KaiB